MNIDANIVEIYYFVDDFVKEYSKIIKNACISSNDGKKHRNKPSKLSMAEVITIMITFHLGGFRNLKHYYEFYVKKHLSKYFPKTVSYNRFVELQQSVLFVMTLFLKIAKLGKDTGIAFVDSTPLRICKNKRIPNSIRNTKTFTNIAARGKSTMGYFYGFKLHLIINEMGEILNFVITPGNVDDRTPLKNLKFVDCLKGKLFADKGYVSQELLELLFLNDIQLVTGMKRNMKNTVMNLTDKILLRKRSVIETVNGDLKTICQVEHSRHRSFTNFLTNVISALIAYSFLPKKPHINYDIDTECKQLVLF